MKVLIAHPGTQYSYRLVGQMERLSCLYRFYTGMAISSKGFAGKLIHLLPTWLYKKISNRVIYGVPSFRIKTFLFIELKTLFLLRKKGSDSELLFFERNKEFQKRIPDSAILESDVVIGFDTSSWILAERCKTLGKKFILDVSIPHPVTKARVYGQIAVAFPQWRVTLKNKRKELVALEEKEMELADCIVVASSFTRKSLIENNIAMDKIKVNPYGVDGHEFQPLIKQRKINEPLRFVFVGLVDARKGVPLLLQAFSELKESNATLTLIGPVSQFAKEMIEKNYPRVILKGKVPHEELKNQLPQYDVMVFPSFFEGFGLVVLEAMACGLVVVSTDATCAPDVIEHGKDGFIFHSGEKEELLPMIWRFLNSNVLLNEIAASAVSKAKQYSWDDYGERWKKIIITP